MHDIYSRGAVPCKANSTHNLDYRHANEKATPDELEPLEVLGNGKPKTKDDVEIGSASDQSLPGITVDVTSVQHNSETEEEKSPP
jgi:hypothetical protein